LSPPPDGVREIDSYSVSLDGTLKMRERKMRKKKNCKNARVEITELKIGIKHSQGKQAN